MVIGFATDARVVGDRTDAVGSVRIPSDVGHQCPIPLGMKLPIPTSVVTRDTRSAMSRENVDLVRRVYEAAASRDAATVLELYDRDIELDNSRLDVVGVSGIYRGHDGLRSFFREWHEAWSGIEYDFDELIDAGGEHVISVVTRRGRGRESGAEAELPLALLWTIREGRVVRVVWFRSREEALEAVGLRDG
jgi:ketosteroid isomerase-like protein